MAQVTFRDGPREVPPHVEELLRGIETYKYTYDEAIARMNNKLLTGYVSHQVDRLVNDHFKADRR